MIRGVRELTHLTVGQERLVRALALASLALGVYWLWWRWTSTLNPDAMVFSVLLVSAETWGWISAALFLFGTWTLPRREIQPAPPGKKVDVFITAFDEPLRCSDVPPSARGPSGIRTARTSSTTASATS
jgi:cellulose synthase (UDP-forming)